MRHRIRKFFILCFLFLNVGWVICLADDLDDGIPIDDSISEYDQIGDSIDHNYSYIALRVQSDVAARSSDMENDNYINDHYVNEGSLLNSVILQAGSEVQGDIIIIDQSRGDKTIIAR
ncbi:MAG: hypothetical protein GQ559_10425 [Desulfobulbaceae bacterium]|nr:hypothetical protein [Desulfobulbaceae bacterium]